MRTNHYIRSITSIVLLAIFALCNTPTKFLHFLFANHKDFVDKTITVSDNPQFSVAGINCHCESNVVVAPYTMENGFEATRVFPVFTLYPVPGINKIDFPQYISFGLRGPPAVA